MENTDPKGFQKKEMNKVRIPPPNVYNLSPMKENSQEIV
jgi:hypothetical protein